MNTDDLITSFRSEIPLPGEATTQRAYARATEGRRRVRRHRLVAAVAIVAAAGIAGGLYASLGGASSNVNPERQQIVDAAVADVRQAFGDQGIVKATLDGSLLTVDVRSDGPYDSVVGPFEGDVLAHLADDRLRSAGLEGVETLAGPAFGTNPLSAFPAVAQLPAGACDIPAGTALANVTASSGRVVPLVGGFCAIRLTTSDPKAFASGVEETLNQLFAAVPAAKISGSRAVVLEADDTKGVPVIVGAWEPLGGGAVYARPDLVCDTPLIGSRPAGACDSGSGNG